MRKEQTAGKTAGGGLVSFLHRDLDTGSVNPVETAYDGPVPSAVWERLNQRFLKLDAAGYFWPVGKTLDAYQDAVLKVCAAADGIVRGKIAPRDGNCEKYLVGVAFTSLAHFHDRMVLPMREAYRAVEGALATPEESEDVRLDHDAPEGEDDGGAASAEADENGSSPQPTTVRMLVETLPGKPGFRELRLKAALDMEEIYAALIRCGCPHIERAFRAYVKADGNMYEAAHLAHVPRATYYRNWRSWLKTAKEVSA